MLRHCHPADLAADNSASRRSESSHESVPVKTRTDQKDPYDDALTRAHTSWETCCLTALKATISTEIPALLNLPQWRRNQIRIRYPLASCWSSTNKKMQQDRRIWTRLTRR